MSEWHIKHFISFFILFFITEKALPVPQIDTLFHLDLRMDNLKGYIQEMS